MQKYRFGDLVNVSRDLGRPMRHFPCDCEAVVIHADSHRGDRTPSYSIHIKGGGEHAWYDEDQLTLIAEKQEHLLEEWPDELSQVCGNDLYMTVNDKFTMDRNKRMSESFEDFLKRLRESRGDR